jgi:hypothetical protein
VPWATHTALPSLVISTRATPLRLPNEMISAAATHTPLDTGRSKFNLNSVVAPQEPAGITRVEQHAEAVVHHCRQASAVEVAKRREQVFPGIHLGDQSACDELGVAKVEIPRESPRRSWPH